jgi:hypothetical protein
VTEVPGYHLDRLIGRGASGEVWLARQRSAGGRVVALKCLPTAEGIGARDQLRVEGRLLAGLDHPNIVTLYDVVERPGGVALVMQYAAGGSLATLLAQRRLTAGQVVTVCAPLADALAYAHARGTVHGDVTPANVLFTEDGRPLLADFGIARVAARLSARSGLVGTPHYLDPHVALGAAPDPASDVYALAAICYEALAGRPPYTGATPFELLQRAREGVRPDLAELAPDTPASLVDAIDAALDPDGGVRDATADSFAALLRSAVVGEPVPMLPRDVAVPVGSPTRPTRDFGPRPPRQETIDAPGPDVWDRLADAVADRRVRLGAIGVLVTAAAASVGLLISGFGDSGTGYAAARAPATPIAQLAPRASSPPRTPAPGGATSSSAPDSPAAASTPAATPSTSAEWRSVLAALDERRARAYEAADVALIDSVYVAGADQRKDHALVAGLARDKQRVVGLHLDYRDVRVLTSSADAATLDVVDQLPPYRQVDASGALVKAYPGRGAKRWVITLQRAAGQWRIGAIAKAS